MNDAFEFMAFLTLQPDITVGKDSTVYAVIRRFYEWKKEHGKRNQCGFIRKDVSMEKKAINTTLAVIKDPKGSVMRILRAEERVHAMHERERQNAQQLAEAGEYIAVLLNTLFAGEEEISLAITQKDREAIRGMQLVIKDGTLRLLK
jgi:hypothetical protein